MLLWILGIWVLAIVFIIAFMKSAKGCSGTCEQGRKPCDCQK